METARREHGTPRRRACARASNISVCSIDNLPTFGTRGFTSIKRRGITALLDRVEGAYGPRQADYCLATVRAICNWYEARNDDYRSPVARGMKRTSAKAGARERILTDDEIRAVWNAAKGSFGAIVKLLLLSAQRLDKVVAMRWADVIDGAWIINTEVREKGNAGERSCQSWRSRQSTRSRYSLPAPMYSLAEASARSTASRRRRPLSISARAFRAGRFMIEDARLEA
jgi:integrase